MKITETNNWSRRDFCYYAKCEHCGNEEYYTGGYDDYNYYNYVIPCLYCSKCGESTNSKPLKDVPKTVVIPRYDPDLEM